MIKRPKPGEDEEDILRMQEEFLREKNSNDSFKPSAQVVNLRRTEHQTTKRSNTNEGVSRKPSKYAQSKGLHQGAKRSKNDSCTPVMGDIHEKNVDAQNKPEINDDKVYFPTVIPAVLGEIVEKSYCYLKDYAMEPMPSEGFPLATRRDATSHPGHSSSYSLHKDQMRKEVDDKVPVQMDIDSTCEISNPPVTSNQNPFTDTLNLPSRSNILNNKDANDIHHTNMKVLSTMSEKEILDEQQKLLSSLDPKLIEFMKMRRKQAGVESQKDIVTEDKKMVADIPSDTLTDESDISWDNDILDHPDINNWLNFDSLEKDKLQWMKSIEESKRIAPDEPYEARFDFKGFLLPYSGEYTEETKTLFHHGDEPHRPGYSLTELIELSRSSITQQRIMALNTIAGILEYHSTGTYKDVIEIPLSKIFFVIRFAMDDNKANILEPALKCMRNLLYNRIDEACLDALMGFEEGTFQPCLENDKSEIAEFDCKESELKDFHLAEVDIITAILRTDIVQRLYYIIDTIRPSFISVQYAMQVLCRVARDSVETALALVHTDHLMNAIIRNFIPATSINFTFKPEIVYNGKPVLAALKFMRILSLQSRVIAETLISKYNILKPLSEYISSGIDGSYGLRVQIESYCILANLLHYDLGMELVTSLFPVIVTTLYRHIRGTDIFMTTAVVSCTHAAVVLQVINKMFNCSSFDVEKYGPQMYPLVKEGATKWILQVASVDSYTCGHLRVVCSVLDCCYTILSKSQVPLEFLNNAIKSLSTSRGIKNVIENLIPCSNLLSGIEERDLNLTKNLMSLGSASIDSAQKLLPILSYLSPVPFLVSLFKVLAGSNNKDMADSYLELVEPYLRKSISTSPSLSANWFTRTETEFVCSAVRLSLRGRMSERWKDAIYAVASKLCFILRLDKRDELNFLFDNVIFNKDWFTAERLFNLVSLSEADGFSKVLTSIEDIKLCYSKVVNLQYVGGTPNIPLRKWQEPILPRDWIYLPILSLYSKSQETPTSSVASVNDVTLVAQKELVVRCSLEWVLFNELCFPDVLDDIDVTDRFCRVSCVFLCDASLFLDAKIKILLHKCINLLFKRSAEFDFEKQLMGLNSFQDFYIQLLEQFQSVSYGDHNFAACVLAPLAQHHNIKWRKTLWSEYAGCLRALDCPEKDLCYQLNKYLFPEETDESVLKCYFTALSSNLLRPGTVVHKIASHHVECFKRRTNVTN